MASGAAISMTPCMAYSSSGKQLGRHCLKTGYMFVLQVKHILDVAPDIVVLENVGNTVAVNNGEDLKLVIKQLREKYVVHHDILKVVDFGDPSNRQRLTIVGIHRRFQKKATEYKFPVGTFTGAQAPQVWHIAV